MSVVAKKQSKNFKRLDPECAAHLRRKALKELAWERWRLRLPDDHHGRAMLSALLLTGMTGPEALRLCPWLPFDELQGLAQWADDQDPKSWNGDRLGELVELTDDEREALKLWPLRPCDVEWPVVQKRQRARKNAKARDQRRKQRELIEMARNEPMREESLLFLIGTDWDFAAKLPDKIKGGVAWRNKRNGRPITGNSLKARVFEALDGLEKRGLIESRDLRGVRGVRRKTRLYAVQSRGHAKSAHSIGTSDSVA